MHVGTVLGRALGRLLMISAALLLMLSAPVAAVAVGFSSGNGQGIATLQSFHRVEPYGEGYSSNNTGNRSTSGHPTYIAGRVRIGAGWFDPNCQQHLSPDRTSSSWAYYYNQRCDFLSPGAARYDEGMLYEHCRNMNNVPDPCGSAAFVPK